jgi:hypothetical protein
LKFKCLMEVTLLIAIMSMETKGGDQVFQSGKRMCM